MNSTKKSTDLRSSALMSQQLQQQWSGKKPHEATQTSWAQAAWKTRYWCPSDARLALVRRRLRVDDHAPVQTRIVPNDLGK